MWKEPRLSNDSHFGSLMSPNPQKLHTYLRLVRGSWSLALSVAGNCSALERTVGPVKPRPPTLQQGVVLRGTFPLKVDYSQTNWMKIETE